MARGLMRSRASRQCSRQPQLLQVGQITLACALGYRDFRFGCTWRADHPRLVAWLETFAVRLLAFAATTPDA